MTAEIVLMLHKAPFFHPSSELIKANAAKGAQPVACQVADTKTESTPFSTIILNFRGMQILAPSKRTPLDFEDTKRKGGEGMETFPRQNPKSLFATEFQGLLLL
jgi:hypothetical protein